MSEIVVTGVSGYIGGQIALALQDAGHRVTGIDRDPLQSHQSSSVDDFVQADFDSDQSYIKLIHTRPDAIIHCAGTSLVGPSITKPSDYYNNNVVKTLHLLNFIIQTMPKTRFIFSSSAAVYGIPYMTPCHEVDPCEPISPYGESKLMVEKILSAYHKAYDLDFVAFRYFNACGADSKGRHGQSAGASHLIARIMENLVKDSEFVINGNDYETLDGTCVRDYIHVEDVANAHVLALNTDVPTGIYNLGSSTEYSVMQIIKKIEQHTGKTLRYSIGTRREGDPAILSAKSDKFEQAAGKWSQYSIDDIVSHALSWYTR